MGPVAADNTYLAEMGEIAAAVAGGAPSFLVGDPADAAAPFDCHSFLVEGETIVPFQVVVAPFLEAGSATCLPLAN